MEAPMRPALIRQSPADASVTEKDRDALSASEFSWAAVGRELGASPDGSLNIAYLAVDRHAHSPRADRAAFRFPGQDGASRSVSYRELAGLTDRFANLLKSLDVRKGDVVFVLCGRIPELYVAVLGALKIGAVASPNDAFAPPDAFAVPDIFAPLVWGPWQKFVPGVFSRKPGAAYWSPRRVAINAKWRRCGPICPASGMFCWSMISASARSPVHRICMPCCALRRKRRR